MTVQDLDKIKQNALKALESINDLEDLNTFYPTVLGRNGELTLALREMKNLSPEERAVFGQHANTVKKELEEVIENKRKALADAKMREMFEKEAVDVTAPGKVCIPRGRIHPMTQVYREIRDAMIGLGFTTYEGPEIEYEDYCFTKLNLPKGHPARDMQDTFYISDSVVLRTHTTPCEVRSLLSKKPPFRLVIPGRVFRVDEVDASHSPVFMQMEGFVVDKNLSLRDLKGTLIEFVHTVFGNDVNMRMRPSYFPFTEPSAEIDISCTICGGKGCRVCKGTGWIEILGCGIINPHVLENCGVDPNEWSAFAFGIGVDRVTSLKFGISDIRLEYENDARFLRQF